MNCIGRSRDWTWNQTSKEDYVNRFLSEQVCEKVSSCSSSSNSQPSTSDTQVLTSSINFFLPRDDHKSTQLQHGSYLNNIKRRKNWKPLLFPVSCNWMSWEGSTSSLHGKACLFIIISNRRHFCKVLTVPYPIIDCSEFKCQQFGFIWLEFVHYFHGVRCRTMVRMHFVCFYHWHC